MVHGGDVWATDESGPDEWWGNTVTGTMETDGDRATFAADDGTQLSYRFHGSTVGGGLKMPMGCNLPP